MITITPWEERYDPEGFKRGAPRTQEAAMALEIAELRAALAAPKQAQEPVPPEQVEAAWRAGWAACRDAEYVGQEAEDEAWGMSQTCANADWENAAPKQAEPLTEQKAAELYAQVFGVELTDSAQRGAILRLCRLVAGLSAPKQARQAQEPAGVFPVEIKEDIRLEQGEEVRVTLQASGAFNVVARNIPLNLSAVLTEKGDPDIIRDNAIKILRSRVAVARSAPGWMGAA